MIEITQTTALLIIAVLCILTYMLLNEIGVARRAMDTCALQKLQIDDLEADLTRWINKVDYSRLSHIHDVNKLKAEHKAEIAKWSSVEVQRGIAAAYRGRDGGVR